MRTTIDVPEPVLERLRLLAAESGRKVNDLVNDALLALVQRPARAEVALRRLPTFGGERMPGLLPGLDPYRYADLEEVEDIHSFGRWVAEPGAAFEGDEPRDGQAGEAGGGRSRG